MSFKDLDIGDTFRTKTSSIGGEYVYEKIGKEMLKVLRAPDICCSIVGLKFSINENTEVYAVE